MRRRVGLASRRPAVPCEPDLSPAHRNAVIAAVRWAWREVCQTCPGVVAAGDEEAITERLQSALNEFDPANRRRAPGIALFETVARGAKVVTASGARDKQPDLAFRPPRPAGVRNLGQWGLFVECKIIDDAAHHTPRLYCTQGVARFTRGEYAPQMRSGMLLAYVRDGRRPHATLDPLLGADYATRSHARGASDDLSRSVHDRARVGCVEVALTHLWLPVQAPRPTVQTRAPAQVTGARRRSQAQRPAARRRPTE